MKVAPGSCTKPTAPLAGESLTHRAVLLPQRVGQRFHLQRIPVSDALAPWLEFHWIVEWDLADGEAHVQRVMPYPNANLVFDIGRTALHGPVRGMFEQHLTGRARVHGVRFKCGGLRPWLDHPMSALATPQAAPAPCLPLDADPEALAQEILAMVDVTDAVARVERCLMARLPPIDPWVTQIDEAVKAVQRDSTLTRAADLQDRLGLGERALQRCFANYVGVSPKWVVQRARIHDALQALATDARLPLADLAQRTGFFDQAHFARTFRQHTGQSPQQYRQALKAAEASE